MPEHDHFLCASQMSQSSFQGTTREPLPGTESLRDTFVEYRRQHLRVSYRDPVHCSLVGHPEQVRYLLAEDLSLGGLMLYSSEPYPLHSRLLMDIEPAAVSEPIRAIGEVVWVARADYQERYRLGVQLVELGEVAKERLRELVDIRGQSMS